MRDVDFGLKSLFKNELCLVLGVAALGRWQGAHGSRLIRQRSRRGSREKFNGRFDKKTAYVSPESFEGLSLVPRKHLGCLIVPLPIGNRACLNQSVSQRQIPQSVPGGRPTCLDHKRSR